MRLTTSQLFQKAYGNYALAAVNVFCMEQVHGLFASAQRNNAPFIVQLTPTARQYAGADMLASMIDAAEKIYPETVFAVHLDHGNMEHCEDAILSGNYTSVMIDVSHDPLEENIDLTSKIVNQAHGKGISVEAELGILSGVEDDLNVDESQARYTNPKDVHTFVHQTKCDSLAVAVGTSHGAYKFSGGSGIQFEILAEIQKLLPGFPLVLHGASAVPLGEIERINNSGGELSATAQGVSSEDIQKAIKLGVCKVNIATDLRLIWTRVYREFFKDYPDQIDLIVPGKQYIEEYANFMDAKFELLGAKGKVRDFETVKNESI